MTIFGSFYRLIINRELLSRFELLRRVGNIVIPEYRFKWPLMDWWEDPEFNDYLVTFGEEKNMNTDRRWMLGQLLRLVDTVPGDTAECGVFKGAGSYLICKANLTSGDKRRTHHMFDSFQGLSKPMGCDGSHWSEGDLASPLKTVKGHLSTFDDVEFYEGWIPDRFEEVTSKKFSFVHVDVDLFQPTMDSLEFFYPRLSNGGIIVCDDYGFASCPGATKAVEQFLSDKKEKLIVFSGGGGFLIKGIQTAIK